MKILTFMTSLLLTACQTVDNYSPYIKTFVGKPESELIQTFGAPDKSYQSGGVKILTYVEDQGASMTPVLGSWVSQKRYCQTTFAVELEHVKTAKWEGNICAAPESSIKKETSKQSQPKSSSDDAFR